MSARKSSAPNESLAAQSAISNVRWIVAYGLSGHDDLGPGASQRADDASHGYELIAIDEVGYVPSPSGQR